MTDKINLKIEQVRELAAELQEVGKTMFLVKRGAIRVGEHGEWFIKEYEGLKLSLTEALPGHVYENDIPYIFWQKVLEQVEYYIYKKAERAREQAEALKPNE